MRCPKCQYLRKDLDQGPEGECPQCGILYSKYNSEIDAQREALRAKVASRGSRPEPRIIDGTSSAHPRVSSQIVFAAARAQERLKGVLKSRLGRVAKWILLTAAGLGLLRFGGLYGPLLLIMAPFILFLLKRPVPTNGVTNCPTCGGVVAMGVKACPHCGKSKPAPKPVGKLPVAVAGVFVFALIISVANLPTSYSEGERAHPENDPQVRLDAQRAISLAGYACASVDSMRQLLTKTGFNVQCNGYRYSYTITDEGGRMIVRLD